MTRVPDQPVTPKRGVTAPTPARFAAAAAAFDWAGVSRLAAAYTEHLHGEATLPDSVADVLSLLRQNLRYEDLEAVADAALAHGLDSPVVRRQYGQALVDGGNPAMALLVYRALAADTSAPEVDRIEARGGIGRCYKELFLACGDPARRRDYLARSVEAYLGPYEEDPGCTWHGVNAVAMLGVAERLGIEVGRETGRTRRRIAEAVLATVDADPTPGPWHAVTACEALVALGRHEEAVQRAELFLVAHPHGFTIASFLRQLRTVWGLDTRSSPGSELLPQLRSALLRFEGGGVTVETTDVRSGRLAHLGEGRLERVLGATRFTTLTWYRDGLRRCRAVARIETPYQEGVGTGFLVAGPDLHPDLPPLVVVTNGHVVPEALPARDARVVFHGLDDESGATRAFRIVRTCWYRPSADGGLDTTVLELDAYPADVDPIPVAEELPAKPLRNQRAYLIGHPGGRAQPQFSLQDNVLLDYDDQFLHYRSPTEGGSSGSPVFDELWRLIGVHHAGGMDLPRLNGAGGTHAANEGIAVPAIREGLVASPPDTA